MGFDFNNNTPIYMQIAEIIEVRIISGEYVAGERLPSVRDLAFSLKANPNTIQRALGDLEDKKLIYTERTNGKFVTNDLSLILNRKAQYAKNLATEYLESIAKVGLNKKDAVLLIENIKR